MYLKKKMMLKMNFKVAVWNLTHVVFGARGLSWMKETKVWSTRTILIDDLDDYEKKSQHL